MPHQQSELCRRQNIRALRENIETESFNQRK